MDRDRQAAESQREPRRDQVHLVDGPGAQPVDEHLERACHDEDRRGDVHVRELEGRKEDDDRQEIEEELHAPNRENGAPMIAEAAAAGARP